MKTLKLISVIILILLATVPTRAQDIFELIRSGDLIKVKETIDANPILINSMNSNGMTPLCFAVALNNAEMVKLLLEKGSLVRVGDNNLRAPLHFANWNKNQSLIELLVAHGALIDTRAIGAATPLIHASLSNDFEMSKFLIERGADIQIQCNSLTTPLYFAVLNNHTEYLDYLIQKGAEIDVPDFLGRTPMYIAVRDGNKAMVEKLHLRGADLFQQAHHHNRTLLHLAAIEGHLDVVAYLIANGLPVNAKDKNGLTPLDYAAKYGNRLVQETIRKKGGVSGTSVRAKIQKNSDGQPHSDKIEAEVIKLQNGSWGVQTRNSFIILGYSEIGAEPAEKTLLNGHITAEIFHSGKKIYCIDPDFHPIKSSYSLTGTNPLLTLLKSHENAAFILNPVNDRRYEQYELKNAYYPKPETSLEIGDMKLQVLPSYPGNLCYILDIDGLEIIWLTGLCDNYQTFKRDNQIIEKLASLNVKPDLLFLGSPAGIGPEFAHGIRESHLASARLNPGSVFVFGHEPLERKVLDQVKLMASDAAHFYTAENPGDRFKL